MEHNPHLGNLEEFIKNNKRLVHSVCQKYIPWMNRNQSFGEYDDLVSVGMLGLLRAYEKFDPTAFFTPDGKGVKFSTYGVPMIEGEIRRMMRDHNNGAKFSRSYKEAYARIVKLDRELLYTDVATIVARFQQLVDKAIAEGRTEEEYRRYILTVEDAERALEFHSMSKTDHLDKVVFNNMGMDEEITLRDQLGCTVDYERQLSLDIFLDSLSDMHRTIMHKHIYGGFTQSEIGKFMGISQVQVSRIITKVMESARKYGEQGLPKPKETVRFSKRAV